MKKFLFVVLAAFFMLPYVVMAQTARQKVAVYMTGDISNEGYKKVIGSKMVSEIAKSDEYIAVERTADFLKALSSEQDYQTSGEVRDNQIVQIGQKFGVRYVAVVDISEVFEELFIAARLIDVQTGQIDKSYETSSRVANMSELTELAQNVAGGMILGGSVSGKDNPFPMALAVEKEGKRYYLTAEQWNKMTETQKIEYKKLGLVIMQNGDGFIMSLPTEDMISAQRRDDFPTVSQFGIIAAQRDMIVSTLKKMKHLYIPPDNRLASWINAPAIFSENLNRYKYRYDISSSYDAYSSNYFSSVLGSYLKIIPLN